MKTKAGIWWARQLSRGLSERTHVGQTAAEPMRSVQAGVWPEAGCPSPWQLAARAGVPAAASGFVQRPTLPACT